MYMLQIYDRALTSQSVPTLVALSILAYGIVSGRIEKTPLTPPMVFVAIGLGGVNALPKPGPRLPALSPAGDLPRRQPGGLPGIPQRAGGVVRPA